MTEFQGLEVVVEDTVSVDVSLFTEPLTVITVAGPPGAPPGAAGGSIFTYTQSTPAATWTISHNLGRFPASVTVWIGDEEVSTDIDTPDTSTAVITFSSPQSGRAELI